jgi:hypothetical protein
MAFHKVGKKLKCFIIVQCSTVDVCKDTSVPRESYKRTTNFWVTEWDLDNQYTSSFGFSLDIGSLALSSVLLWNVSKAYKWSKVSIFHLEL